eukprot:1916861-Amphidinium_carterae.1
MRFTPRVSSLAADLSKKDLKRRAPCPLACDNRDFLQSRLPGIASHMLSEIPKCPCCSKRYITVMRIIAMSSRSIRSNGMHSMPFLLNDWSLRWGRKKFHTYRGVKRSGR